MPAVDLCHCGKPAKATWVTSQCPPTRAELHVHPVVLDQLAAAARRGALRVRHLSVDSNQRLDRVAALRRHSRREHGADRDGLVVAQHGRELRALCLELRLQRAGRRGDDPAEVTVGGLVADRREVDGLDAGGLQRGLPSIVARSHRPGLIDEPHHEPDQADQQDDEGRQHEVARTPPDDGGLRPARQQPGPPRANNRAQPQSGQQQPARLVAQKAAWWLKGAGLKGSGAKRLWC